MSKKVALGFPYKEGELAPRTAGSIASTGGIQTGTIEMAPPGPATMNAAQPQEPVGRMAPYIGDTQVVYANSIQHAVLTGTD